MQCLKRLNYIFNLKLAIKTNNNKKKDFFTQALQGKQTKKISIKSKPGGRLRLAKARSHPVCDCNMVIVNERCLISAIELFWPILTKVDSCLTSLFSSSKWSLFRPISKSHHMQRHDTENILPART